MPTPSIEEGQAPRPVMGRRRACIKCAALFGQRCADDETTHLHGLLHATRPTVERPVQTHRDEACIVPLTPDRPQACEPRCADVFKHYLACADRIEQKGAGAGAASLNTTRRRTPSPRPHKKNAQATASPTTSTGSSA